MLRGRFGRSWRSLRGWGADWGGFCEQCQGAGLLPSQGPGSTLGLSLTLLGKRRSRAAAALPPRCPAPGQPLSPDSSRFWDNRRRKQAWAKQAGASGTQSPLPAVPRAPRFVPASSALTRCVTSGLLVACCPEALRTLGSVPPCGQLLFINRQSDCHQGRQHRWELDVPEKNRRSCFKPSNLVEGLGEGPGWVSVQSDASLCPVYTSFLTISS